MLFNSYAFILEFLPLTLAIFFCRPAESSLGRGVAGVGVDCVLRLLVAEYIPLLLGSVAFNFLAGRAIAKRAGSTRAAGYSSHP